MGGKARILTKIAHSIVKLPLKRLHEAGKQEQLDILKQGGKVWNQWREEHPDIRPTLSEADLSKATLSRATLVETNFVEATLTNCRIYGISAWNVVLEGAKQDSLVITREGEPTITVDYCELEGMKLGTRIH